jgi:hypothetical protein
MRFHRGWFTVVSGLTLIALLTARPVAQGAPGTLLAASDIERLAALHGVQAVARASHPAAIGDLNFSLDDGSMLLVVNFFDATAFSKKPIVSKVGNDTITTDLFHADVPSVGDDAFDGPPDGVQFLLYVRKGTKAFSMVTFSQGLGAQRHVLLTQPQLREIAKTIVARM